MYVTKDQPTEKEGNVSWPPPGMGPFGRSDNPKVYIQDQPFRDGLDIYMADKPMGPRHELWVADFGGTGIVRIEPHVAVEGEAVPLFLPYTMARTLYDALARQFGGHGDALITRRDLEHTRQRLDHVTDHVLYVLNNLSAAPVTVTNLTGETQQSRSRYQGLKDVNDPQKRV
jgi:hypothetical protein